MAGMDPSKLENLAFHNLMVLYPITSENTKDFVLSVGFEKGDKDF